MLWDESDRLIDVLLFEVLGISPYTVFFVHYHFVMKVGTYMLILFMATTYLPNGFLEFPPGIIK